MFNRLQPSVTKNYENKIVIIKTAAKITILSKEYY